MDVILLEKIANLGVLGDKVSVKPGYGRNYLIPTGRAVPATEANVKKFEARRAELEQSAQEKIDQAEVRKEKIDQLATITVVAKAGTEGKLFGSVGTAEISDALKEAGIEVERREIRMPEGAIRVVGEHEVQVHLHTDVDTQIKVVIEAE